MADLNKIVGDAKEDLRNVYLERDDADWDLEISEIAESFVSVYTGNLTDNSVYEYIETRLNEYWEELEELE